MRTVASHASKSEAGFVLFLAASNQTSTPVYVTFAAAGTVDEAIVKCGFEITRGSSRLLGFARATAKEAANFTEKIADRQLDQAPNWYLRVAMAPILAQLAGEIDPEDAFEDVVAARENVTCCGRHRKTLYAGVTRSRRVNQSDSQSSRQLRGRQTA